MGYPHAPIALSLYPWRGRVPLHVDIARRVGPDRAASVESGGRLNEVPLRLERQSRIVEARVKHRRRTVGAIRLGLARTVPRDMHAAVPTDSDPCPADIANRDGASGRAVDPDRPGERPVFHSDVKDVPCGRIACEINHVRGTAVVDRDLRLDPF